MAVFSWTGKGGNTAFGTPSNWDDVTTGQNPSPVAPGSADTADITASGKITGSGAVADLNLASAGGTLTMDAVVNAGTYVNATGTVALGTGGTLTAGLNFSVSGSNSVVTVGSGGAVVANGVPGVNNSAVNVAYNTGDVATMNIAGGRLTTGSNAIVGGYGNGTLKVSAGGTAALGTWQAGSTSALVGFYAGSQGTLMVTGTGSTLTASGHLDIGVSGAGTLTVQSGANLVENAGSFALGVGENTGSTGTVTVSNAHMSLDGFMQIGGQGTGSLTVQNAGTLSLKGTALANTTNYGGAVADKSGSHGTLTVTGAGSTFTSATRIGIGENGTGTLDVLAGAKFMITGAPVEGYSQLFFADQVGSSGTGLVSGKGSTVNTGGGVVNIGNYGTATLTVAAGGTVDAGTGFSANSAVLVGSQNGGVGALVVTDAGTLFDAVGQILIGNYGSGSVLVENGATMETGNYDGYQGVNIAASATSPTELSSGSLTVTGVGSALTNSGRFEVGGSGAGTLTVSAGAHVATTIPGSSVSFGALLGGNSRASGLATVTGAGSSWTIGTDLAIGISGAGTLDVTGGGAVSVGTNLSMANSDTSAGVLLVDGSGSKLTVGGSFRLGGQGTASATISNGGSVAVTGSVDVNAGLTLAHGTLSTASALYVDHAGAISGNGTLSASTAYIDQGTVSATGGNLTFIGQVVNDGAMADTAGGTMTLGHVGGAGTLTLGGSSTLLVAGVTSAETIDFVSKGLLQLTAPSNMAGVLEGFASGDTIDLGTTAANTLNYTGGVLTVANGASTVAQLHFAGSYTAANFALGTSGAHTVITYQS